MGKQDHHSNRSHDLPQVLILNNQTLSSMLEPYYSGIFRFTNLPSSVPLHQFLTAHNHDPSSFRVLIRGKGAPPINNDFLCLLPALGLLVTLSTGTDHIDLSACRRRGVQVANARSLFSVDVADLAVGLFIDVMRKITAVDRYVRTRLRPSSLQFPLGSKVGGKQVGIVGLGSIGLEVARRLEAFGCIISYYSRTKKPFVPYAFYSNVVELAASCDALIICCALNEQTRHMISREVMLALGKEGVLVNVARGTVIDENEMVRCLMEGEIGGAGLDVFENEPHVPKELFHMDNVVLSPHVAAHTLESYNNGLFEVVVQNLDAFYSDKPLVTPVFVD